MKLTRKALVKSLVTLHCGNMARKRPGVGFCRHGSERRIIGVWLCGWHRLYSWRVFDGAIDLDRKV